MNKQVESPETWATNEVLLEVYRTQWNDLHNLRQQEWQLSRLLLFGFLGIGGLHAIEITGYLIAFLSAAFSLLSALAIVITVRHNFKFKKKISYIQEIEAELGVTARLPYSPRKQSSLFSTGNIMILVASLSCALYLGLAISLGWASTRGQ